MGDVKVSIICNTYNHEKYIKQALRSIVDQKTNFKYEVLVHDDASTDKTAEIIREFEKEYPDVIKPIYQAENQYSQGVSVNKKFQYPRTKGKYVAICEGDDYWTDERKLQKQFDFLETHEDYVLVAHGGKKVSEENEFISEFVIDKVDYEKGEVINHLSCFPTASMFYRASAWKNNEKFVNIIATYDYAVKAVLSTEGKVHVIPESMSAYRVASKGSWTERIEKKSKNLIKHLETSVDFFEKFDLYREGQYHDYIQKEISRRKFKILLLDKTKRSMIKILKTKEYRCHFRKYSIKKRIGFILNTSLIYCRIVGNKHRQK